MTLAYALEVRAFDAPFLGIPAEARHSGRAEGPGGEFVEIFLDVRDGTVREAGFLTNVPGDGLLCASFWCEAAQGSRVQDALGLEAEHVLACFPPDHPPPAASARLAARAGRRAALEARGRGAARDEPGRTPTE